MYDRLKEDWITQCSADAPLKFDPPLTPRIELAPRLEMPRLWKSASVYTSLTTRLLGAATPAVAHLQDLWL